GAAVHHVEIAVAAGVEEHLALAVAPRNVGEDDLIDIVVIEQIVGRALVIPDRFTAVDVAGEDARRPFVVARPLAGVPRPGIAGAVVDQVRFGVVADPAPHRPAADLPRVWRPRL